VVDHGTGPRHWTVTRHWTTRHWTTALGTALDGHGTRHGTGQSRSRSAERHGTGPRHWTVRTTALDSQDLHGTGQSHTALDSQDLDLQRDTALDSQDLDLQRSGNPSERAHPSTQASKGAISREDRIQLRTVFKTTGRLERACTARSPSARRRAKQIVADDGSALRWPETWKRVALSARL